MSKLVWRYLMTSKYFSNNKIALASVFSVIYLILRLLPALPWVGVAGVFFSVSDVIAPVYGIMLGPYTGPLSIAIGTFLAIGLGKPPVFLGLDFLPAFFNAMALGFLVRRKWLFASIMNFFLLLIFCMHPYTLIFVNIPIGKSGLSLPLMWMHFIAFLILLSPLSRRAISWIKSPTTKFIWIGMFTLSIIGTFIQHLTGNILFETILGQLLGSIPNEAFPTIWTTIFWVYPIERTFLIITSSIIGTLLIKSLRTINLKGVRTFLDEGLF